MHFKLFISSIQNNSRKTERKELVLSNLLHLLTCNTNDDAVLEWNMYFLGIVQTNFNQGPSESVKKDCSFSLDVLTFCIVLSSGSAVFVDNEITMRNRIQWIHMLPEALWLLCERSQWAEHLPRVCKFVNTMSIQAIFFNKFPVELSIFQIFEFLYHLNVQKTHVPKEYASVICNTLICVKNHQYFLQRNIWNKFISLK